MRRPLDVISLLPFGPAGFEEMVRVQKAREAEVKAGGRDALFLLEHRDVITSGRNASLADLKTGRDELARLGVELVTADRGGKLTFHGPGQLVAYPVLNLSPGMCDIRRYVRLLEESLILTVGRFGIEAGRSPVKERWSSVWVGNDKLAAIGIHLSRWVTTHGAALNVHTDLARFSLFVPCGITDGGVTSMQRILGPLTPTIFDVAETFVSFFCDVFSREPRRLAADEIHEQLEATTTRSI